MREAPPDPHLPKPPPDDWEVLKQAAADFRYLLARGYPREASLTLVGNRYNLSWEARQLLHRGVFAPEVARARRAKLRRLAEVAPCPLALDGHNVLITVESALRGRALVLADDGFVRDVARLSRAYRGSAFTTQALSLLGSFLASRHAGPLTILYDAPMKKSGELASLTRRIFQDRGRSAEVRAVPVPERDLLVFEGAVATSDTQLIDAREILVDLAGEIIREELGISLLSFGEA